MTTPLLEAAAAAHGGWRRWRCRPRFHAKVTLAGVLLAFTGRRETSLSLEIDGSTLTPEIRIVGLSTSELVLVFTPARVWLERSDGTLAQALDDPRAAYCDTAMPQVWDDLRLAYAVGGVAWRAMMGPIPLGAPGVQVDEIASAPRQPSWRRLRGRFPAERSFAEEEVAYFDDNCLLRRLDYSDGLLRMAGESGGRVVHGCDGHVVFDGRVVSTLHTIAKTTSDQGPQSRDLIASARIERARFY